jgi:hypothetical protein
MAIMLPIRALPLFLTLVLSAPLSPPLRGQTVPSPYRFIEVRQEAGAFAGVASTGVGIFGFGPRSGNVYGARYGIDLSGPFGLEGVFTYLPTTRDVIDPRRPAGDRVQGEADVQLLLADARLRFTLTGGRTWNSLAPFLFAGAGLGFDAAGTQEDDEALGEDDRFDFGFAILGTLGGGIRWMVSERVLVRGDAQLTLWQLDTPEGFLDPTLDFEAPPTSEWANNRVLTLGIAYRF